MTNERIVELLDATNCTVCVQIPSEDLAELCNLVIELKHELARVNRRLEDAKNTANILSREKYREHDMGQ